MFPPHLFLPWYPVGALHRECPAPQALPYSKKVQMWSRNNQQGKLGTHNNFLPIENSEISHKMKSYFAMKTLCVQFFAQKRIDKKCPKA
jgi:hypothetical protein